MIVSIDKEESQIWPTHGIKVIFNGEIQKRCFYADDEKGIIKRYIEDKNKKLQSGCFSISGDTEELKGDVQIINE